MLTYPTVYDGKSRDLTIRFQSSLSSDFHEHKACSSYPNSVTQCSTALIQLLYDHSRFGFILVVQDFTNNQHLLKFMF